MVDDAVTRWAWLALVLFSGAAITWVRTRYMAEASALFGFEPSALVDPVWSRPDFAADFPNSEAETLKSLVGQVYRLLGLLPVSKQAIVTVMVFAEFCTLAAGTFVAVRAADPRTPSWIGLGAALMLTAGTIISCDLARWFHPNYGSVYNFAYGAGLIGFAAMLDGRPLRGGVAVGIAGACHPLIALFFGLAMAAAALVRLRRSDLFRLFAGGAAAAAITGGWALVMLGDSGVSGADADAGLYIALARMMSSHWFPFTIGVFGARSWETLLPFTGFMVLFSALLGGGDERRNRTDRQIAVAVAALVALALAGAIISEYSGIPFLVKLALHRASGIALMLAAIVVVPRLLATIFSAPLPQAALAVLLLLMPFWRGNGLPILLCVLFVLLVMVERRHRPERLAAPGLAVAAALAVMGALYLNGTMPEPVAVWTLGYNLAGSRIFVMTVALALLALVAGRPVLLVLAFAVAVYNWVPQVDKFRRGEGLEQARAYLEVQQWARANTEPGSLFMTDPGHAYGWREHSGRPSFGTLREWLYTGWLYDTRGEVMREGIARAEALGLDVDAYVGMDREKPRTAYAAMRTEAARLYHDKDAAWFTQMSMQFGIDYFVLDKEQAPTLPVPPVFENGRYAVISISEN